MRHKLFLFLKHWLRYVVVVGTILAAIVIPIDFFMGVPIYSGIPLGLSIYLLLLLSALGSLAYNYMWGWEE